MAHVKSSEGYDVHVPNQGQVTYNTVAGSAGLASFLGINAGNLLNGFGWGNGWNRNGGCVSPADMPVTRYEMAMQQEIASKDSKIALLEANTYQDQKSLELYKYVDSKFNSINEVLAAQAVRNQAINDSIQSLDYKTMQAIALEAERRQCADCKIVNYVNSTFTPKLITDYTAGTTSAVAQVYNPLACGQCGCGGGNTFAGPAV
jgi:Fe-S cluster assembly iron-binding protein IscA